MTSGARSSRSALPTARAVATRSADELAMPLPSGRLESMVTTPPPGAPAAVSSIFARRRALCLCAGRTSTSVAHGSARNCAVVQRATGSVTRKSASGSGSTPCSSSPNVPNAVLTPAAPR